MTNRREREGELHVSAGPGPRPKALLFLASALLQVLSTLWFTATPQPAGSALAYIDPGAGALLLQIAASFVVGLLFYLRSIRRFCAGLFRRLRSRDTGGKTDTQA